MDWRREYCIQFEGLKEGVHHYDFQVDDAFFSAFEGSLIDHGSLSVSLEFEKKSTMMVLQFAIKGNITRACDHCGDPLDVPVNFNERLIVKFGEEGEEPSEELAFIPYQAHEVDVAPFIYEFIVLNLPLRNVHAEGECNPEASAILARLNQKSNEETDPRWGKLKDLSKEH